MKKMTTRRRLLISAKKRSRLPEEYQEVAWLRGSGSQWCYLPSEYGIGLDSNNHFHGIKGDLELLTATQYSQIVIEVSSETAASAYYTYWRVRATGGYLSEIYHPQAGYQQTDITHTESDGLVYHFEINKNSMIINDSVLPYPYTPSSSYLGPYISVGAMAGQTGRVIQNNNVLIKNIKLTYDDAVICEFIPCYRVSDNKAGLFYWIDYSQGTSGFITNQGTGSDWLVGPEV